MLTDANDLLKIDLPNSRIVELEVLPRGSRYENEWFSASNLPMTCRLIVETSYGEGSLIRSAVWMPENWNGMLVGIGNGGFGGVLRADYAGYAKRGFAVAETDMGTSLYLSGERTRADKQLFIDSGVRSTHAMTVIAKQLIAAYYGSPVTRAYFIGYSAGGKQALSAVQRFPEDYDGVIAGVPSNNALPLVTYFLWCYVHLTTRDGYPLIATATASRLTDEAARFFETRGGAEKGSNYVSYSWHNENTVADFIDHLRTAMPELTEGQLAALRAVYEGPVNPKNGKRIYTGMPIGSETACGYMRDADKPRRFDFEWFRLFFGEGFCPHDFDFADDYEAMNTAVGVDFTFNDPDISRFTARGGRLLIFSGISDPYGPWAEAMHYYNGVCRALGGHERAKENVRVFFLPGKGHSIEGRGTNAWWADEARTSLFDAMCAWCEGGKAPESLVAAHLEKDAEGNRQICFMKHILPYAGDKREGIDYPPVCHPDYAMPGN